MLQNKTLNVPQHVAIIMDGNGRWAKQKGRMRIFGHKNGVRAVQEAVRYATKMGVRVLTLYAFSSENWNRPAKEVSALMLLFMQALEKQSHELHKNNIRLKIIGDRSRFSEKLQNKIKQVEKLTENNTALVLNVAANYGGRWDILQAAKKLAIAYDGGEVALDNVTEDDFQKYLVTENAPPVDLLIRTSGEQRLSNFLLWQAAYAELFFTDVLWPDFTEQVFHQAVINFQQRERRFGGS
ncbi:polyprenyl diphosphate synthase [Actinobacillus delphinicola]|uniref:Ditrans,polycis-undecaprenyl-diphosphate synthase ((2E,6E)-farnesyl-diphosphate specific) n=1 Tax=Actinobacillus delphinicola TaxID=51161 RepID=A0A448TS84_9PAST|nr:polyprenyl diphosphate synthase [Actinobacillus delphinicola]VEJ08776.1 undecaprenyl diphosphate synthase [Actinobacillus delphinicola]